MSDSVDSINNKAIKAILASENNDAKLEGNSKRRIAEALLQESDKHSNDSKSKGEEAREYLNAADALEKMADAVREKAQKLRTNEVDKDEIVKEIAKTAGVALQIPVPKDATPEELENIADALENKARENRVKADNLLKESEVSQRLANQLREQVVMIVKKEMNLTELQLKSALAHNEGLSKVLIKLGIERLDNQYKEQVSYSEKMANS